MTAAKIGVQLRSDLQVSHQRRDGVDRAVIKDPLQHRFFEMDWEDYRLATGLRARATAPEIVAHWRHAFPELCADTSAEELESRAERLCTAVRRLGLAESSGLKSQAGATLTWGGWVRSWLQRFSAPLFVRLRLFDPDRWLTRIVAKWRPLFSAPTVALLGVFVLVSALACLGSLGEMEFHPEWFRSWGNLAWLYLGIVVLKVVHESGHALVCKALGGEVHEVGAQMLVFHPTFFVDVSDTWMWPERRRRIAVAAAGFGAELVAAAVLFWVWRILSPGFGRDLCLHLMFIASVSALLFNANPLMRYDGYHMLADFVREPHLRQKAFATISRALRRWVLGAQQVPRLRERKRWLFAGYGVLSAAYLVWIAFAIGGFLQRLLAPFGLEVLGQIALVAWLASMAVPLVGFVVGLVGEGAHLAPRERWRPIAVGGVFLVLVAAILFVPLPVRVERSCVVEMPAAGVVRTSQGGVVREIFVREGDWVRAGQRVASIENRAIALAHARAGVDLDLSRAVLLSALGESRADRVELGMRRLNQARANDAQSQRRHEELELVSPCDGIVLTRLLERQQGRTVRPGDEVLRIAEDARRECLLPLSEKEARRVREGARAEFRSKAFPSTVYAGVVSAAPLRVNGATLPQALTALAGGDIAVDARGKAFPSDATHVSRLTLVGADAQLRPGLTGRVRLDCGRVPAARWLGEALLDAIHLRHRL